MELLARDWSDEDIRGLLSGNLLRIMDKADEVKAQMSNEEPSRAIYDKRCDLPAKWGGVGDAYLPTAVKEYIARRAHDEL
jgi:membrane dipeptidase